LSWILSILPILFALVFRRVRSGALPPRPREAIIGVMSAEPRTGGKALWREVVGLAAIGTLAGLIGSFFGVGGGIALVPILVYALRVPMHRATATSLATMPFVSLAAITTFAAAAHSAGATQVHWLLASFFAPGAVLGSMLVGVPLARKLRAGALRRVFGIALVAVAVKMLLPSPGAAGSEAAAEWPVWSAPICGLAVGTLSGLLGIGGGILCVPLLALGFQLVQHDAHATSLAVVLASVVAGTCRAQTGPPDKRPDWRLVRHLAPGALVGGVVGPMVARVLSPHELRTAFAMLLTVAALGMLDLKGFLCRATTPPEPAAAD